MPNHTLTYSHGLMIALTRSCGAACQYCTFKLDGSELLTFDQVENLIREHVNSGICEVVLSSGQSLEAVPDIKTQWSDRGYSSYSAYVRDICQLVLENGLLPTIDIGPLTFAQIEEVAPYVAAIHLPVENVNPDFCRAFQTNKSIDSKIESLSDAGLLGVPVHTGLLLGLGETQSDRIATIDAIAEISSRHGHVQSVSFQCVINSSDDMRLGIGMDELQKLLAYCKNVIPTVPRAVPFNSPNRWVDALASDVDDIGVAYEGYDGIDWKKTYPKLTEMERSLARRGYALRPRFPITAETYRKRGVSEHIDSVLSEWLKKKEFQYYKGRS